MSEQDKDAGDCGRAVKVAAFMAEPSDHLAWEFALLHITKRS